MATSPSKPKSKATKKTKGLIELGDSGTEILKGFIHEEYNPRLKGRLGLEIYEEMRKSDGTVRAAMLACTLPILRANWYVEPASEDKADVEIADFVGKCLFEQMTITWDDFLRQALLMLPFGHMVFEKVFTVKAVDGVDRIIWEKFAPRMPKSIQAWLMENEQPGIQQNLKEGGVANIPIEKLLIFVNEKEGDNWEGTSLLRAAYKHWYMKNGFYKIDAIAFERQGLGIPYVKLPEGYNESDRSKAENILKNLRAHHYAFLIEPHDYEIGFKDMMGKSTRDPKESVAHHDRQITKSVLAQFLELGSTDSGSRALSEDQTELFLQSLESIANNASSVVNTYAIKQLVDLNFPAVERYPRLKYTGISRTDAEKLTTSYNSLVSAGSMRVGDKDEVYFRELLGLPARDMSEDEDLEDEEGMDKTGADEDDAIDEVEMSEFKPNIKKKIYPERSEIAAVIKKSLSELNDIDAIKEIKRRLSSMPCEHKQVKHVRFFNLIASELTAELNRRRKNIFAEDNDFKSFRKLTFAEKKIDFNALEAKMDALEESFDKSTQALLKEERTKFINALAKAVQSGDRDAIKNATMKIEDSYARIIKEKMREAYEYGKTNAAREMGVSAPASTREALAQIDIQAQAIAESHIAELTTDAKLKVTEAMSKGETAIASLAIADAAMNDAIDELTRDTSRIVMAAQINNGRNTVFQANMASIYALQRSEILDYRTCNYCLSVDGRIVDKNDSFAKNTIFHSSCRGIWVEILMDEEELPAIDGIPQSIKDRFGDSVNDLIQPKNPITKKDSLAREEVERRARRKAKKENSK